MKLTLPQENLKEHASTGGNSAVFGLATVMNKFVSYAALIFFCSSFCFVVGHLLLGRHSTFAPLLNCNLRGRLEHCSIVQIAIFNSQPNFTTFPTSLLIYNSTFQPRTSVLNFGVKQPNPTIQFFPISVMYMLNYCEENN